MTNKQKHVYNADAVRKNAEVFGIDSDEAQ
jgi:hypothetical protein